MKKDHDRRKALIASIHEKAAALQNSITRSTQTQATNENGKEERKSAVEQLTRFLDTLFSDFESELFVEIRPLDNPKQQEFFENAASEREKIARKYALKDNICVGIHPRFKQEGTAKAVAGARFLVVDFDRKDKTRPIGITEMDVLSTLEGMNLKPTMIVHSGNGYHAYLKVNELIPPQEYKILEPALIDWVNKHIDFENAHADRGVADLPHVMRVPSTFNVKDGERKPIRIVYHNPENVNDLEYVRTLLADYVKPKPSTNLDQLRQRNFEPIESATLDELEQRLFGFFRDKVREGERHRFYLSVASFLKYHLPKLGLTYQDCYNFTVRLVSKLTEATDDEETKDRLRAVFDTFHVDRAAHKETLTTVLGEDGYEELKRIVRGFRKKQSPLERTEEIDEVVGIISRDLKAVTYADNKFILWFANGDTVEYSEKPLFTYVVETYRFFPEAYSRKQISKYRWDLMRKLEPIVAERRVKSLRSYHEGIHKISSDEFLIVLDDENIYVYNALLDSFIHGAKVHGNNVIEVRNPIRDFDVDLFERLLSIPKNELLNYARNVHEDLQSYIARWNFENPESVRALASLLMILPLHTAWAWRPILHFYGAAGSGKTTFFEFTFRTIYPNLCIQKSDTSKAGLLQQFSNTSYVALFDNLETSQLKKQDFFTVLEGASTGFEETKGTKDGRGVNYTFRNLTIINSVKDFVQKEALDTRTIQFTLHRPTGERPDPFPTERAREIATVSLAFSLRFWKEISQCYDGLSRKGRAYQNIAYMYAVDKILNETRLEVYEALLSQRRTKSEEIDLFRDILYATVKFANENRVILDIVLNYVQTRKRINEIKQQSTDEKIKSIDDDLLARRKLSEAGVAIVDPERGDFEIAFDYQRLVSWKIIDPEQITKSTFETMCKRVKQAGIPCRVKSVKFGDQPPLKPLVFELKPFLKFLEILSDDE